MARITVPSDLVDPRPYVFGTYAPKLAKAGLEFSAAVYQGTQLEFRVVEAARIRTSQINGCRTCMSWRAKRDLPASLARKGGDASQSFINRGDDEPDEEFYAAIESWRESPLFNERERLAIEFAERMGADPHSFEFAEDFWARMHASFTDAEIVDMTLSVASWIAMGRTLHVLDIDPVVCAIDPAAISA